MTSTFVMDWTGTIKPVNVELPEDLHRTVRSRASERGKTAKQAYIEALESWLGLDKPEAEDDELPYPRDVRDGDDLVREFKALLKHPGKNDHNLREFIVKCLRDPEDRAERAAQRPRQIAKQK